MKTFASQHLHRSTECYLTYHLLPKLSLNADDVPVLLARECVSPVIDYYETTLDLGWLMAVRTPEFYGGPIQQAFEDLAHLIQDPRLTALAFYGSGEGRWLDAQPQADPRPFDLFLRGRSEEALTAALAQLEEGAGEFEYIELAARLAATTGVKPMVGAGTLAAELVRRMSIVLSHESGAQQETGRLFMIAANFAPLSWANGLFGFCQHERRRERRASSLHSTTPGLVLPATLYPPHAIAFGRYADAYLSKCVAVPNSDLVVEYCRAILDSSKQTSSVAAALSPSHARLLNAERLTATNQLANALSEAEALLIDPSPYFRHKAIKLKSEILLAAGMLDDAVRHISTVYLANPNLHSLLPVSATVQSLDEVLTVKLAGDPSLAILYDIHGRHISDEYKTSLQYAFEDLLAFHGVTRPSELGALRDSFDLPKLTYFLHTICVPAIMDISGLFASSAELDSERIAICQLLAEVDPARKDRYQAEMTDISRKQLIKRRMREVEQSKIYVDVDSLRSFADKHLRDSFTRYAFLQDPAYSEVLANLLKKLQEASAKLDRKLSPAVPGNERDTTLKGIIIDFRDQFVSGSEHGLDGYLSVRIRHGALAGELRGFLESRRLLSQRERGSTEYRSNEYWPTRVGGAAEDDRRWIGRRLARFAKDWDAQVETIKRDWLQIKKSDTDIGLFDFRISDNDVITVAAQIGYDTTFEQFYDIITAFLWTRLESSLAAVRYRFLTEARSTLDQLLQSLESDLGNMRRRSDAADLDRAIKNARTDLPHVLARISEWFQVPRQPSTTPFPIEDAITIAVDSVKRFYKEFDLAPRVVSQEHLRLPGRYLAGLVDVLINALENVAKHAQTAGPPKVTLMVQPTVDTLNVVVESEIGPTVWSDATVGYLNELKGAIAEGTYRRSVAAEGGHRVSQDVENPSSRFPWQVFPRLRLS